MATYNILDFGATGDGQTNDAEVIQKAIDLCNESGGGQVIFPAGHVFITGPIHLKSHVNLYLVPNAVLQASTNESLYTETPFRNNYSEGSMWISAREQENIAITGTGTLNSNGRAFMLNEEPTHYNFKFKNGVDKRPHLLTLIGCKHITIRDVTFEDAAYWCVHPGVVKMCSSTGYAATTKILTTCAILILMPASFMPQILGWVFKTGMKATSKM